MATPIPTNTAAFTLDEALAATGASHASSAALAPSSVLRGVSTDTRTLEPGGLFVALRGERFDGHAHLAAARERGALAAVVARGTAAVPGLALFEVDDTLAALGALGRAHLARLREGKPCVAVGGAAGKTTTKELCAALLRALAGETLATQGNLNNRVGAPMTLLTATEQHRAFVIEVGTNTKGEIEALGGVVEPDVALVLNAHVEHTEGLGTLDDVKDEEAALFRFARRAGVTLASDAGLVARLRASGVRALTYGEDRASALRDGASGWLDERSLRSDGAAELTVRLAPREGLCAPGVDPAVRATLPLLGRAAAIDAAAAVVAVSAAWSALHGPLDAAALAALGRGLAAVRPAPGRMVPVRARDALLLDDTYNANPGSMGASLEAARELAEALRGRLVLVLGDMLELGALAEAMHASTLREALAAGPAEVLLVGPEFARAAAALEASGAALPPLRCVADAEAAGALARASVRAGDVVLLKGSRGLRLERALAALR